MGGWNGAAIPLSLTHGNSIVIRVEPNAIALFWFIPLWSACCIGFLHLSGMFPINDASNRARAFVLPNTMLFLALLAGTLELAHREFRWTTIVVVALLLFLFLPEAFQALPPRWQDGRPGAVAVSFMLIFAIAALIFRDTYLLTA